MRILRLIRRRSIGYRSERHTRPPSKLPTAMKWDFLRHLRRTVYCGIRSLAFLFSDEEACRAGAKTESGADGLGFVCWGGSSWD